MLKFVTEMGLMESCRLYFDSYHFAVEKPILTPGSLVEEAEEAATVDIARYRCHTPLRPDGGDELAVSGILQDYQTRLLGMIDEAPMGEEQPHYLGLLGRRTLGVLGVDYVGVNMAEAAGTVIRLEPHC